MNKLRKGLVFYAQTKAPRAKKAATERRQSRQFFSFGPPPQPKFFQFQIYLPKGNARAKKKKKKKKKKRNRD